MINEPHAATAETAGFFSRDDVTYLEHNCASSLPPLPPAGVQKKRQGASHLLPFLRPRTASFLLSPRPGERFCVFVRDKSLLLKLHELRQGVTVMQPQVNFYLWKSMMMNQFCTCTTFRLEM